MSNNKEFDTLDAFVALRDVDDDSVASMVRPRRSAKLQEGKGYPLYGARSALDSAKDFLNENDEIELEVIDADADTIEHVKDRIDYVGQMILRCNRCHSNRFIDMENLVESDDEGVYNVEDECPNCKTSGTGYEIIGQVGKYEEEKPAEEQSSDEAPAEGDTDDTAEESNDEGAAEDVAVENDEAPSDDVTFDNDLAEEEPAEDTAETDSEEDAVVDVSDETEEETEPDMMETDTTEDDDDNLPDLDVEEEEEEDVKESFYKPALYEDADKSAKYEAEARMYSKIIDQMANYNAADDFEAIWEKYAANINSLTTRDIVDLKDEFEEIYRKYHNDGLLAADPDVVSACHSLDKEFGLAAIETHQMYTESVNVIANTTISEVLESLLDADKVDRIEITNKCQDKKDEKVYDGDYNNLPLNLASATCTGFDVNNRTLACNIDQDENHGRRPLADILDKFGDDKSDNIHLYDIASSDEIFKGTKSDAVNKYGKCGFISIDTPAVIRFTICDPSVVSRCKECDKSAEDTLIEHIITQNDLSITRLNSHYSNEFWISESIKDKDDLDLIYEAYVKPLGRELMAEFKAVTGYSNALDEAYEAGYKAASGEDESEENVNEVFDYAQDDETFELEWLRAAMLNSDGDIVVEDFATVTRHVDGSFTVDGELMFSDGHTNIVDALAEAIETIPDADKYADIEVSLEDDLDAYVTAEDKAALATRLGRIVEEVAAEATDDAQPEEVQEDLGRVFRKIFKKPASISTQKSWEERLEWLYLELEDPDLSPAKKASINREIANLKANFDQQRDWEAEHEPETAPKAHREEEKVAAAVHEGYLNREQMISELKKFGKNYYFDKYTDTQIYRIYEKELARAARKHTSTTDVKSNIATLIADEDEAIQGYDAAIDSVTKSDEPNKDAVLDTLTHIRDEEIEHIDELEAAVKCVNCGTRLNDGGTCPVCDDGEEHINEALSSDMRDIVADSINHMINDLGYNCEDEEFADDVLADMESNYDIDIPEDAKAYAAWASEIFEEINKQVSKLPKAEVEELEPVDNARLRQIVHKEMPLAIKEWGTSISKLTNHFLTVMREAKFQEPNRAELKELIAEYLENREVDVDESFQSFKTRKDLAAAITEYKNNSTPYTVRRSVKEGYRYDLVLREDAAEDEQSAEDISEGDNLPAAQGDTSRELTPVERELSAKIQRISQDIANAINVVYGIDADPELIVADILQDLRLISRDIDISDLEDTPLNRLTADMYRSYEAFYEFMDQLVSGLTGQEIHSTPEQKLKSAIRLLDSPNFSPEAIRAGIEDRRFMQMVSAGQIPFIPRTARPLLGEAVAEDDESIDVNVEQFDSEMNEYFNEAYDTTMVYTTTGGTVESDGTIMLEGVITTEDTSSEVNFTLTPERSLYESFVDQSDKKAVVESATYEVKNNISEEVFTFKFSE